MLKPQSLSEASLWVTPHFRSIAWQDVRDFCSVLSSRSTRRPGDGASRGPVAIRVKHIETRLADAGLSYASYAWAALSPDQSAISTARSGLAYCRADGQPSAAFGRYGFRPFVWFRANIRRNHYTRTKRQCRTESSAQRNKMLGNDSNCASISAFQAEASIC